MVLQLLQVKYLCSLSAWRARAPAFRFLIPQYQFTHFWFSVRRRERFLEKERNRITIIRKNSTLSSTRTASPFFKKKQISSAAHSTR